MDSVLKIKPMVIVRDGEVQSLGRASPFSKAFGQNEEARVRVRSVRVPCGVVQHHLGDCQ